MGSFPVNRELHGGWNLVPMSPSPCLCMSHICATSATITEVARVLLVQVHHSMIFSHPELCPSLWGDSSLFPGFGTYLPSVCKPRSEPTILCLKLLHRGPLCHHRHRWLSTHSHTRPFVKIANRRLIFLPLTFNLCQLYQSLC